MFHQPNALMSGGEVQFLQAGMEILGIGGGVTNETDAVPTSTEAGDTYHIDTAINKPSLRDN